MKYTPFFFVLALVACSGTRPVAVAPSPASMDHAAMLSLQGADAVLWQNSSAEAYRLFQQGYELARLKLDANLAEIREQGGIGPYAVIVDVDETVLDNSPYQVELIKNKKTYDQDSWKAWTDRATAKACPGAVGFLAHARSVGCDIFYITNRDIREQASTLKNLTELGFPQADEAHLLLMEGSSDKTERRAAVARSHRIALLVGDQLRDFDEHFKDRKVNYGKGVVDAMSDSLTKYFVLLPNPMYGTYRDAVQGKGTDEEKQRNMEEWFRTNGY